MRHSLVGHLVDAYTAYEKQKFAETPRDGGRRAAMSVEINNESGVEVDETVLQRLTGFVFEVFACSP